MLSEKIGSILDILTPYKHWLCWIGGGLLLGCIGYCTTAWIPMGPPSIIIPDIGLICGVYCGTRIPIIGYLTILTGVVMLVGGVLLWLGKNKWGVKLAMISGILTIPVGILPLVAAYLAKRQNR